MQPTFRDVPRRHLLRAALSAFVALAAGAAFGAPAVRGDPAPEIQTTDWIRGDGRTTLADFRGQVVYLEFWKTHCGASRGDIRHLVKLAEDYGRRGLEVIALTGDDDRRGLLRFLAHADATPTYRIAVGGGSGYAVSTLPYRVLVGADGKLAADTGNGQSISDKEIEAALKAVKAPGAEELEARAARRLAFAEAFAADRLFLRAEFELQQTVKGFPGTASARRAAERLKSLGDADAKAELEAQRDVGRLAGLAPGAETPLERVRPSEAEALAKKLAKKADDLRAKTPRAAKLAQDWAEIYAEPWK